MAVIEATKDEELVKAVLAGNVRAFNTLVERYLGMVYVLAYARLGHSETAEDLAQEVFLRAYLYLGNLDQPRYFSAWVTRIARNLASDWLKRGQRASRLIPMVPMEELTTEIVDTEAKGARERMETEERDKSVREAIMKLPPDLREVVMLHFAEGVSKTEIARLLRVHPATVGRHLTKALAKMKGMIEPILHESAPAMRAPRNATVRTILLIGTAAAMSVKTKAALAAAAGGVTKLSSASLAKSGGITPIGAFLGLLKTITADIATGGIIMGMGKKIAITVVAMTVLGGGAYYYSTRISKKEMVKYVVEKRHTVSDGGRQSEIPLDYEVEIKPSKAMRSIVRTSESEFIATGVGDITAIRNIYPNFRWSRVVTDFSFQGGYDIYLKVPRGHGDLLFSILQKEFEHYFGLTSHRETREMDVYILTAPKGRSPNLREPTADGKTVSGPGKITVSNLGLDNLIVNLEFALKKPVIDETNLKGRYDYEINYDPNNPESVIDAIRDQFWFELTPARRPIEVLIIEKKAP